MKILIASDKFKGSISATAIGHYLAQGIRETYPKAEIVHQAMADGGDGSIDLLNEIWHLEEHSVVVSDPLFRQIRSSYFSNETDAFIEMAKASGLMHLQQSERNPMKTTSLGTGALILDAFSKGFKNINLFIGGSATNDGGIGIAKALGYSFLDENGEALTPIGENLLKIRKIEPSYLAHSISKLNIQIICDVNNPFYGENGAARVYARQKGATDLMIAHLDKGLQNLAQVFQEREMLDISTIPGAGAAGGVGGGMMAFFNAKLVAGIDFFIELFELEEKIKQADVVISGEGQLDSQSLQGKVVGGILQLCKKHQKPLIVVCGQNKLASSVANISQIKSIMDLTNSVDEAIRDASNFVQQIGKNLRFDTLH